jgi:hypothetical protein
MSQLAFWELAVLCSDCCGVIHVGSSFVLRCTTQLFFQFTEEEVSFRPVVLRILFIKFAVARVPVLMQSNKTPNHRRRILYSKHCSPYFPPHETLQLTSRTL